MKTLETVSRRGLDSGMATLFAEEIILALRYINGLEPVKILKPVMFTMDSLQNNQRNLGNRPCDGRMPAFAAIIGERGLMKIIAVRLSES